MAKFYGSLKGSGGEVTRCGTAGRGIEAHVRGWEQGIRIHVRHSRGGDRSQVIAAIEVTGGSNDGRWISRINLGESDMIALREGELKLELVPVIRDHYESRFQVAEEWSVRDALTDQARIMMFDAIDGLEEPE